MAAEIDGVFRPNLQKLVREAKLLVIGAGGIGCEVLKNLVMSGFEDIEIVSKTRKIVFLIPDRLMISF